MRDTDTESLRNDIKLSSLQCSWICFRCRLIVFEWTFAWLKGPFTLYDALRWVLLLTRNIDNRNSIRLSRSRTVYIETTKCSVAYTLTAKSTVVETVDKSATTWIRQLVAVDIVANSVDFVASVYRDLIYHHTFFSIWQPQLSQY